MAPTTTKTRPATYADIEALPPNVVGWPRERLAAPPDTAYIDLTPDWIAEIVSPGTQQRDRTDKPVIYAAFDVGHAWYVDPIARTHEAMTLTGGKWLIAQTHKDDDLVAAPPFEAHAFRLDVQWPDAAQEAP